METEVSLFAALTRRPSRSRLDALIADAKLSEGEAKAVLELHESLDRAYLANDLLRALYDTATDLTALRDVEAVLHAIVRRTRILTGADMAYISLNDHTKNETYIRKSDGVVTAAYRSIRMPLGAGVLGKAATGLAPIQTLDYLQDDQIEHLENIDQIVAGEGVRAILGVPMSVHGVVRGALMIANRRPTSFGPETIDIVDTIGKHAAVALDNAQRFTEVTAALQELGSARDIDQEHLLVLRTLVALDERLIEAVIEGGGPSAIAEIAAQTFAADIVILDEHHEPLASHGIESPPLAWLGTASDRARVTGVPVVAVDDSGQNWTVVAANAGRRHLASVAVAASPDSSQLSRVALHTAASLLFELADDRAGRRRSFELLDDLLAERPLPASQLNQRLSRSGIDPAKPVTLIVIATDEEALVRRAFRQIPTLIAPHRDHICVLHSGARPNLDLAQELFSTAKKELLGGYVSGISRLSQIPMAHRQAETALACLKAFGVAEGMLDHDRVRGIDAILAAFLDGKLGDSPIASIRALLEYDHDHDSDLVATAWCWLENGGDIRLTASALFVHPNTVRQRLARISVLLGTDWAGPIARLETHLALKIAVLAKELGRAETLSAGRC